MMDRLLIDLVLSSNRDGIFFQLKLQRKQWSLGQRGTEREKTESERERGDREIERDEELANKHLVLPPWAVLKKFTGTNIHRNKKKKIQTEQGKIWRSGGKFVPKAASANELLFQRPQLLVFKGIVNMFYKETEGKSLRSYHQRKAYI